MFTGLIEAVGTVVRLDALPAVTGSPFATSAGTRAARGDSLAVNGVCLTVVGRGGEQVAFDLGARRRRG